VKPVIVLDTTYFLPIVGIKVKSDFFLALEKNEIFVDLRDIYLSEITLFELQAKATKLSVPPERVAEGIDAIREAFNIIPFYEPEIIKISFKLRRILSDYIDCVILATAISREYILLTEDSDIQSNKQAISREISNKKVEILNLNNLKLRHKTIKTEETL